MSDTCDSCGDIGADLITVQRVYLEFDSANTAVGEHLSDEFETWCVVCRLTYPHQEVVSDS